MVLCGSLMVAGLAPCQVTIKVSTWDRGGVLFDS